MSKTPIRKCANCGSTADLRELKSGLIVCEQCIQAKAEEQDKAQQEAEALVSNLSFPRDSLRIRRHLLRRYRMFPLE
jgi:recombinational DNA repair protein (RecF pathway)